MFRLRLRPATVAGAAPAVTGADVPVQPHLPPDSVPARQRDPFLDNAKYLAVVLVAVGHAWEPLRSGSRGVLALYMVVYAFHMPAFVLVSGHLSRGFELTPRRAGRLVTSVAVPYLVFETAYALFERRLGPDPDMPVSLLDPWFLTWFLAALFVWRLTAPLWRVLRWPLPVALVMAALASLSPAVGDDLDLQRVLQFLPYFVLGLTLRPGHLRWVQRRAVRTAAVPVFCGAWAVAYWAAVRMNDSWFYHCDSAQELGAPWWAGPVMQLALLGCALVLTACFLAWVPRRRTWCTALGTGTLCGYLLHGFLVKGAAFLGWYDHPWVHTPAGAAAVTLLAAAAVTLLCTPPVRHAFRHVMEPGPVRLLRTAARQPGRAGD
jgi:fucose 4-O-acetylase-like acetyltransferase